jgi:hypothetical protein
MPSLLASLWRPVAAAALVHLLFLGVYLGKHRGDASVLVCAGACRVGAAPYEYVTRTVGPSGHDGQFYYSLARAPWRCHGADMDLPAVRHLRIAYPALCWLTSAGHPRALFYVMPAINWALIVALSGLGSWLALRHGRSPWWGFLLPLGANLGLSLLHNFTDVLSTAAVFALLAAWLVGARWHWLALAALVALFSREQNLAVICVIALAAAFQGRRRTAASLVGVMGLWLGWVCLLRLVYGTWPLLTESGQFEMPFAGMCYRWAHLGGNQHFSRRLAVIHAASMVHLILLLVVALVLAYRLRKGVLAVVILGGSSSPS